MRTTEGHAAPTSLFFRAATFVAAVIVLVTAAGNIFAQPAPAPGPDSTAIIQYLEQTIAWYRQLDALRQLETEPGEVLLLNDDQQMAGQIVRLAFDFARAAAESLKKQPGPSEAPDSNPEASRFQSLQRMSQRLDQQIRETRAEVDSLRQKLVTATGKQLQVLKNQIAETQSELDLAEVRRDSLRSMVEFVGDASASGLGASGLQARIEALAQTVPAVAVRSGGQEAVSPGTGQSYSSASGPLPAETLGVWGLATDLLTLSRKMHSMADIIQATDALAQSLTKLRKPFSDRLREMSSRSDALAKEADTATPVELAQAKKDFDVLTAQFKRTSTALLPLSKQRVLLDIYKQSLRNWQGATKNRYDTALRRLVVRLALFVFLIVALIGAGELWRRSIVRYVQDPHRRHQYLLLRRIVLWCLITVILVIAFASELGSVATFAGLMTAGVAVALQNVILSIVGYFLLIGKFGIRVGDRVQVAGVTGEVVDIGLLRFHLLELVSGGGKIPSGRAVAFSNSIVFQSTAGLFKQIPGTNFVWHEITLTLSSDSDYSSAEERLHGTVEAVFSEYRESMERQHRQMQRTLTIAPEVVLRPNSRLRFTQSGLEVQIRYPVDLQQAGEIDDRVTRELLKAIEREPGLKLTGPGASGIRLRTDLSTP